MKCLGNAVWYGIEYEGPFIGARSLFIRGQVPRNVIAKLIKEHDVTHLYFGADDEKDLSMLSAMYFLHHHRDLLITIEVRQWWRRRNIWKDLAVMFGAKRLRIAQVVQVEPGLGVKVEMLNLNHTISIDDIDGVEHRTENDFSYPNLLYPSDVIVWEEK